MSVLEGMGDQAPVVAGKRTVTRLFIVASLLVLIVFGIAIAAGLHG